MVCEKNNEMKVFEKSFCLSKSKEINKKKVINIKLKKYLNKII